MIEVKCFAVTRCTDSRKKNSSGISANICTRSMRRAIGGSSRLDNWETIMELTGSFFFPLVSDCCSAGIPWLLAVPEKLKFWRRSQVKNKYWNGIAGDGWKIISLSGAVCDQKSAANMYSFLDTFWRRNGQKSGMKMLQRTLVRLVKAWGSAFAGFSNWEGVKQGALWNTGNDLNNVAKTERDVRQFFTAAQPRSCER